MSRVHFFCALLLASSLVEPVLGKGKSFWDKAKEFAYCNALPITAGVAGVAALPFVLTAAGFGTAGIAAGSLAAKGMSIAATTGKGMAIISAGQSAGAAGAGLATKAAVGTASYVGGRYFGGCSEPDCKDKNK